MKKPDLKTRQKMAKEQRKYKKVEDLNELAGQIIDDLKKREIDGSATVVSRNQIKIEDFPKIAATQKRGLIFIEFTMEGYIIVVGAGVDIGVSKSKISGQILEKTDKIKEELILIKIENLESIGLKKIDENGNKRDIDNVLKCRNGIENYIGNYLSSQGYAILNICQHCNYKKEIWKEWEKNNYSIL